ncbi:IS66 family insertion sequence element accessory protein TnpB [Paracoccus denitrificans]|uniref:IS66 family insertion sequence element accessory protein TnpB n=1 Tax=Paracoccus denitrificans TaxID=266 RepID=UPI0002F1FF66|nr:IS66 family insertion sequence element accessory protein TnpB [Paracoccus denitrificans]MBB4629394.1 transposase [Paracoccus denitrificans]MCU7430461.1 IS66 family insertion sequence element accessory protein TnpB [Paracoccus denitrificans]UPV97987.1 IS66 family insertion sequence element accessory protein TnpB [Paracoccus denitrificans]GEK71217.1 hypothetical protein PDE01_47370 [Paracoccus denitrificans]
MVIDARQFRTLKAGNAQGVLHLGGRIGKAHILPHLLCSNAAGKQSANANLIFKWLRDPRYAPDPASAAPPAEAARFLPVEIVAETRSAPAAPAAENHIEIELAGGHRMRISGSYDPEALARLIRGLSM